MPRLNGDKQAAVQDASAALQQPTAQAQVTGGGEGPFGALAFAAFAGRHLPQLRKETAEALAAMPGLGRDQKEATLVLLMDAARQAYGSACAFQTDHAGDLERRSAEQIQPPKEPEPSKPFQLLGDKIKGAMRGREPGGDAHADVNRKLWDKGSAHSPFMQAVAAQIKEMLAGLLTRVAQEASGECTRRVMVTAGDPALPLPMLLAYAKAGAPAHAPSMHFIPTLQTPTVALQLAKDYLVAGVLDPFMAAAPEKLAQDAEALLATTAKAHGDIVDLVSKAHGRPADFTSGLAAIVAAMVQRMAQEIGPWLGLNKDQAVLQDQRCNTGHASDMATRLLARSLQAAALAGPAGAASTALWHASSQVAGLGLGSDARQQAGAYSAGGASKGPPPTPDTLQKLLELETSGLAQQAGGAADLAGLRTVMSALQPLVTQRLQDNHRLWGACRPEDFERAQSKALEAVQLRPQLQALGLGEQLPDALKSADAARWPDPVARGDLMTRLALAWGGAAGQTGAAALAAGVDRMLSQMGAPAVRSTSQTKPSTGTGASSLNVAQMTGGWAAAAQVVLHAPMALLERQSAVQQMVVGNAEGEAAVQVRQTMLDSGGVALVDALGLRAAGAGAVRLNPLTQGLTTAQEVQTQAAQTLTPPSAAYSSDLQEVLSSLQDDTALSVAEKAAECGRRLAAELFEKAGDGAGLKALQDFDVHTSKAAIASKALAAGHGVFTLVTASRVQLQAALQNFEDDAPAKKEALSAFSNLPTVKHRLVEHADHTASHRRHQASSDAALAALLPLLVAALPKNAAQQPVLDASSRKFLSAFLNFAYRGTSDTDKKLEAALKAVPGGVASRADAGAGAGAGVGVGVGAGAGAAAGAGARASLKKSSSFEEFPAFMAVQKTEFLLRARELTSLRADANTLKRGAFDELTDRGAVLKKFSTGTAGRDAVLAAHHVGHDGTGRRTATVAPSAQAQAMVQAITLSITGFDRHAPALEGATQQNRAPSPGMVTNASGATGGRPTTPPPKLALSPFAPATPPRVASPPPPLPPPRPLTTLPPSRAASPLSESAYADVGPSVPQPKPVGQGPGQGQGPRPLPFQPTPPPRGASPASESAYEEVGPSAPPPKPVGQGQGPRPLPLPPTLPSRAASPVSAPPYEEVDSRRPAPPPSRAASPASAPPYEEVDSHQPAPPPLRAASPASESLYAEVGPPAPPPKPAVQGARSLPLPPTPPSSATGPASAPPYEEVDSHRPAPPKPVLQASKSLPPAPPPLSTLPSRLASTPPPPPPEPEPEPEPAYITPSP